MNSKKQRKYSTNYHRAAKTRNYNNYIRNDAEITNVKYTSTTSASVNNSSKRNNSTYVYYYNNNRKNYLMRLLMKLVYL